MKENVNAETRLESSQHVKLFFMAKLLVRAINAEVL